MTKTPKPFADIRQEQAEDFRRRRGKPKNISDKAAQLPRLKIPKKTSTVHLVIGDSHSHPDEGNQRFESLGRMVKDISPDVVIDIGDSADMASLLHVDTGGKGPMLEGHSYWRDIDTYHDAKQRYHHFLGKGKQPRHIRIMGNHEDRITRFLDIEPRFMGVIGTGDLCDEEMGWEFVPFLEPIMVDGVVYSHYFKSPGSHRPVSGAMPSRAVLMKYPGSFTRVFGHTHSFGFYEDADGYPGDHFKKISVLNAGCYFDPKMSAMRWSGTDKNRWRPGILVIEVEPDGQLRSWQWHDFWDIQRKWGRSAKG